MTKSVVQAVTLPMAHGNFSRSETSPTKWLRHKFLMSPYSEKASKMSSSWASSWTPDTMMTHPSMERAAPVSSSAIRDNKHGGPKNRPVASQMNIIFPRGMTLPWYSSFPKTSYIFQCTQSMGFQFLPTVQCNVDFSLNNAPHAGHFLAPRFDVF